MKITKSQFLFHPFQRRRVWGAEWLQPPPPPRNLNRGAKPPTPRNFAATDSSITIHKLQVTGQHGGGGLRGFGPPLIFLVRLSPLGFWLFMNDYWLRLYSLVILSSQRQSCTNCREIGISQYQLFIIESSFLSLSKVFIECQ